MLIVHMFFLILPSLENYGCYGNEKNQNVSKTYGSQKIILFSLMKLGM